MADRNFGFLEEINPKLYWRLLRVQKKSRTNLDFAGNEIRKAYEEFVHSVIQELNLESMIPLSKELASKVNDLRNDMVLQMAGYLRNGKANGPYPVLPEMGTVKATCRDGKIRDVECYDFIRHVGNAASHTNPDPKPFHVDITYGNLVMALRNFQKILKEYYKDRITGKCPDYNEFFMPIEEYQVYKEYIPSDTKRSKCRREFLAYKEDGKGSINRYVLLRLYEKSDLDETFLLRNEFCFTEASKMSITEVPEGLTTMREIVPIETGEEEFDKAANTDFYIMEYSFATEPFALNDKLLSETKSFDRLKMCYRIAKCLYNLERFETPIYHRLLNHECIFVCKKGNNWVPIVTKLDFAKVESSEGTVIGQVSEAKDAANPAIIEKNISPEWKNYNIDSGAQMDWEKVDVYALGMLFSDILKGEIGVKAISLDELDDIGVSEDVVDLIDRMTYENPQKRCGMREVVRTLEDVLHI